MRLGALSIFCGSNPGARPEYRQAAKDMAVYLAGRSITLVYGGAVNGLMGEVADAALAAGGRVVGVIPEDLLAKEVGHQGLTELFVVATMHERKARMAELSDGFIALPGGMGTLEEICETITWTQLGLQAKPCGFLNVAGYYDLMRGHLDRMVEMRFLMPEHRAMVAFEDTPEALVERLSEFEPPTVSKWYGLEKS